MHASCVDDCRPNAMVVVDLAVTKSAFHVSVTDGN